ncbi:L-type lectin-domain containing receptor kinase IX.1 [Morus notabilis]|uniref:L-type lectin-domain containing receptor kinase IX.1 n=1 Tax=Morus notabilis TaxID=981085 RepID=UPI000CED37FB|nr:L-type lectin-domain containing receptor kinase IX.1 [Morus notabilis]
MAPIRSTHSFMVLPIFLLFVIVIPFSTPLEFNFPEFGEQHKSKLRTQGNITYLGSEIELTTANKTDQIGRVTYLEALHLWDNSTGSAVVADFTTDFSFIVHADKKPNGDGIAFFLAQPPYDIPKVTDGSGIGLVSSEERESTSYSLVAIEFDTLRNQDFDPEDLDEHVGIDVNSVKSKRTTRWSCDITSWNIYNATISYNSRRKNLSVLFTGYEEKVPVQQQLFYEIDLAFYLPELVSFGFSAANGLFTSRHILRSWSFKSHDFVTKPGKESSDSKKTGLVVGLSVGAFVILVTVLCLIGLVLWKKRTKKEIGDDDDDDDLVFDLYMDDDFERNSGARRFSYDELLVATNNFAEEEKLGQGGFGGVYRGFLKSLNSYVAIKKVSSVSNQGVKEYASEVKIISQLRHRNLVQLIGWCHRKKDLLLIYEFMPNGSLDSHLFKRKSVLTWATRYNIARGMASALLYLHQEWEQCVLHRDIKASNIMLDSNFNAKLGDFGLARLVDHDKGSQTTALAGTLGYMAPECVTTGRASRESDIYSFGVVALEIACGRKAIEPNEREDETIIVESVWDLYGADKILEAADPTLCGAFNEQQMERLMIVGLWCAHPDHKLRPSIKQAIHVLDFEAPLPVLPSHMPLPSYLPCLVSSFQDSGTGSTSAFQIGGTQPSSNTSQYTTSSQCTDTSSGASAPSMALLSYTCP